MTLMMLAIHLGKCDWIVKTDPNRTRPEIHFIVAI